MEENYAVRHASHATKFESPSDFQIPLMRDGTLTHATNHEVSPYESFSEVYEELMDDVPYGLWCERICSILGENGIKEGLVLDICCGTGSMTRQLRDKGFDMIGIDKSEEMLSKARMEDKDNGILYLCQDARNFELYGTVKAAVCVCDSLNYILDKKDIVKVFKKVNNYLEDRGLFIFDVNTDFKFREILGNRCIAENRPHISYIWDNFYDEEEKLNEYELTLFLEREEDSGLFEKHVEYHYERAYSIEEIKECLEAAGMELIGVYNGYEGDGLRDDSERALFVAREGFQEGKYYSKE